MKLRQHKSSMLNNIKGVIFDLDGTIADSMWVWEQIDDEFLSSRGITLSEVELENMHREMEGLSFAQTADYFINKFSLPETSIQIQNLWNEMAKDYYRYKVKLKDGALSLLKRLNENNIRIGMATSNSRELVSEISNHFHLNDYFDSIVTSDDVRASKPAPDVYLKASNDIGVEPASCLVFEDLPNGILAGKAAGMKVCAIEDKYSAHLKSEKIKLADYFIDTLLDI